MIARRIGRTLATGIAASALLVSLSACMSARSDQSLPGMGATECGAGALEGRIGQEVVQGAGGTSIGGVAVDAPGPIRVIAPGQPVTQDYSPARLNLDVDASGRLVRPWCG